MAILIVGKEARYHESANRLEGAFVPDQCVCFFFFQAEDGIRDLTVTGVQTCALPIYRWIPLIFLGLKKCSSVVFSGRFLVKRCHLPWSRNRFLSTHVLPKNFGYLNSPRSEERRVGKECRSRWSPYH